MYHGHMCICLSVSLALSLTLSLGGTRARAHSFPVYMIEKNKLLHNNVFPFGKKNKE